MGPGPDKLKITAKAWAKRRLGKLLSRDFLEKLTEYSISETESSVSLREAERIVPSGSGWLDIILRGREELWSRHFKDVGGDARLWLEFGVHTGDSLRFFTGLDPVPKSLFYGFDSFEGLPEDWRGMAANNFDVGGLLPRIDDERVNFVKGWFQHSLPGKLDELAALADEGRVPIVHFDADLYSSTLYLLFMLSSRFRRFHFIFDEFQGHETRALFNFLQATGATARFRYRLDWEGFPQVVSGELEMPATFIPPVRA